MSDKEIKLHETTEGLAAIFEQLEETGGELTPDIEATLDELTESRKDKAERIVKFARRMRYMADAIEAEINDLKASRKRKLAAADRTEGYLLAEMQLLGDRGRVIHTDLYTIKRARVGRPKIELKPGVDLEDHVPADMVRETIKRELDKNKAYEFLKQNDGIPTEIGQFTVGMFNVTTRERLSVS